ncbi:cupin domain-containing protein [Candidatus Micrarchaeota archaeon]|nr:cupin domain-containing protein [Candidatus Micrarchaeota archaeon]MBU1930194.1 cupin domain-containing protein [Candidatus Micrarchaeota archaeon]
MEYFSLVKPPQSKVLKAGKVVLSPGESVGKHSTEKKEGIIIVQKGTATILEGQKTFLVKGGETHFIPENTVHDVQSKSREPLEYFFVVSLFENSKE